MIFDYMVSGCAILMLFFAVFTAIKGLWDIQEGGKASDYLLIMIGAAATAIISGRALGWW